MSAVLLAACTGLARPQGWAAPVAADDTLLVSLERGKVTALDPATGQPRWTFPGEGEEDDNLDLEAIYGSPVIAGERVYVGAYDGAVYALEINSGTLIWRAETKAAVVGGPAVAGDTVYVGSLDKNVYALDAATGQPRWPQPFQAGAEVFAQPVVQGDLVYIATMGGRLFALDAATGQRRWPQPFEADAALPSAPALDQGRLYIGSLDDRLYALDAADGRPLWSFRAGNWFWTTPLVQDGVVYAAALDMKVYALDAASGQPRWARPFETQEAVRATPALVGGVLVVADRDGNVYGLNPDTGAEAWPSFKLEAGVLANPLVLTEAVYLSTSNGELVMVEPSRGSSRRLVPTEVPTQAPTP